MFLPWDSIHANWNNFVINFNKMIYGRGVQTWQITPYNGQWTYFANKNGVLQFDGDQWDCYQLNNFSDVRSVMVSRDRKRIYAGGINEFGFFEPDQSGNLTYHCISDTLDSDFRFLGNVWGIHEADNMIFFQGDNRVIKMLDGRFTAIGLDYKIDCSSLAGGTLYLGTSRGV